MKTMSRRTTRAASRGFSLIEILVVMALIGVILALVATRIDEFLVRGKIKATQIALDTVAGKINTYIVDNGVAPAELDDLVTMPVDAVNWQGPYATEGELKDAWKRELVYRNPGAQRDFDLLSHGPDGKPGGVGFRMADISAQ